MVQITDMKIDDIVTGDFVLLQAGGQGLCGRLPHRRRYKVNQASLNGESEEAKRPQRILTIFRCRKIDFLDPYKVYRGSVVTSGEAIMQVKCVGDQSQFGRLAQELKEDDERESPLKVKLGKVADAISNLVTSVEH